MYYEEKDGPNKVLQIVPMKTGSTTLRSYLNSTTSSLPILDNSMYWGHHLTVEDVKGKIDLVNTVKVVTVRNPFDRLYSLYVWFKKKPHKIVKRDKRFYRTDEEKRFSEYIHNEAKTKNFIQFVNWNIQKLSEWKIYNMNIVDTIVDKTGKIQIDYIIRCETFNRDFDFMIDKGGLKKEYLKTYYVMKKEGDNYCRYYDYDTIKLVEKYCYKDLAVFGYRFGFSENVEPENAIHLYQDRLDALDNLE